MGKLKKRSRSSRHRVNPLSNQSKDERQDASLRESKILPIIAKLKSVVPNDKSMALGTISVMCEDSKLRNMLLKEKLLQLVMEQCLNDENSEIIVESFGLLRNLVIEEGYDVAMYLWRQNIWVTIESNFEKAKVSFDAVQKDGQKFNKNESRLLFDYIENLISLIVGLGNASDDIFEQILNKVDPLINFIKEILTFGVDLESKSLNTSVSLFNSILDLIYDFSSQSIDFINGLNQTWNIDIDLLERFLKDANLNKLPGVYIQGIKLQILEASETITNKDDVVAEIVNKIISEVQDINIENARNTLIEKVDNTQNVVVADDTKKRATAKAELQAIALAIELITAAIEIIAVTKMANDDIDPDTQNDALLDCLLNRVPEVLTHLLKYDEFRTTSLTALNNLSWLFATLRVALDDWALVAKNLWGVVTENLGSDIENKISSFGILWAIISVVHEQINIDDNFAKSVFTEFENTSKDTTIDNDLKEEYLVRLVGFLGTLAQFQGNVERNAEISQFLFQVLHSLPNLPSKVAIEILDSIYEIYGDAEYDYDEPVFVQRNYLNSLQQLTPKIKHAVKLVDKNVDPELKAKGEDVFVNLSRFIDYKKKERS